MPRKTEFIEAETTSINFNELIPYIKNRKTLQKIKKLAKKLKNRKILHINAIPKGGGVAELLKSQVPLERDLGIDTRWLYIKTDPEFFVITKKIHNLMQGAKGALTPREKEIFRAINKRLAKTCRHERADIIMVHDPQPAAIIEHLNGDPKKIIRLHIDLETPNKKILDFFKKDFLLYDAMVITHPEYKPRYFPKSKTKIITPAVNPLLPAHQPMAQNAARMILEKFGVNPKKPVVSQVSRFDPWKDPLGVIDAYYRAKNKIANLQLILLGIFLAQDDPEALTYFNKVKRHAEGDNDIYLFADASLLKTIKNDILVNSVQNGSDVILQKSIREGFGMTATEAMWKRKAVIGGDAIGIRSQIKNGKNGYIVKTPADAAKKIVYLLRNKKVREKIGRVAKKTVEKKFLIHTYLLKHLELYAELLKV